MLHKWVLGLLVLLALVAGTVIFKGEFLTVSLGAFILGMIGSSIGAMTRRPFYVFWLGVFFAAIGGCIGGRPFQMGAIVIPLYGVFVGFIVSTFVIINMLRRESSSMHRDGTEETPTNGKPGQGVFQKPVNPTQEKLFLFLLGPFVAFGLWGIGIAFDPRRLTNRLLIEDALDELPAILFFGIIVGGVLAFLNEVRNAIIETWKEQIELQRNMDDVPE